MTAALIVKAERRAALVVSHRAETVAVQHRASCALVGQRARARAITHAPRPAALARDLRLVARIASGTQGPPGAPGEAGPPGPPGAGSSVQDNFDTTPDDITNRFVVLSAPPADPLKVELVIYGGPEQQPGVDFVVTGNVLSWHGLALELLLEAGATFSVRYFT